MRKNCTPGSVRGRSGNRPSCLDYGDKTTRRVAWIEKDYEYGDSLNDSPSANQGLGTRPAARSVPQWLHSFFRSGGSMRTPNGEEDRTLV